MDMEKSIRKRNRVKKIEKRHFAKSSGTLSGQMKRIKSAKGYAKRGRLKVKVKI